MGLQRVRLDWSDLACTHSCGWQGQLSRIPGFLGCLCFKYLVHLTDLPGLAPRVWDPQRDERFWEQTPNSPNRRLRGHSCVDSPFLPEGFPHSWVGKESICNARDPRLIPGSGRSFGEGVDYPLQDSWACLVVQLVKNLPAMQETWVWLLGWEDPLEKGTATHSSILAWRIP